MSVPDRRHATPATPPLRPDPASIPSRAALTELARGFLILHDRDPGRARAFAATFVREHASPPPAELPVRPHLPAVRRSARVWGIDERAAAGPGSLDPALADP